MTVGPSANVQWWNSQFADGSLVIIFGAVLLLGSSVLIHRSLGTGNAIERHPVSKARAVLLSLALGLTVGAAFATALPMPQRALQFSASEFTLEALPGHVPYENYFVSVPFEARAGESILPLLNLTLTDNRTGALEYWDPLAPTWYTSPSAVLNWSDPSTWAWGAVVPRDGAYVLWVRYDYCATPGTVPCDNYTGSVQGELRVSDQLAYEPWMFGFGLLGSAAMVAAVVQSGMGRRRTTS